MDYAAAREAIRPPARWTVGADINDVLAELGVADNADNAGPHSWEATA